MMYALPLSGQTAVRRTFKTSDGDVVLIYTPSLNARATIARMGPGMAWHVYVAGNIEKKTRKLQEALQFLDLCYMQPS